MKNNELKIRVEELCLTLYEFSHNDFIGIYDAYGEVAWVSTTYELVLGDVGISRLSIEVRTKLFDILVEYARTPIEDRKDEKRYSLYPIRTKDHILVRYDNTFREHGYEHKASFAIRIGGSMNIYETTVFLEHEAKEICDLFGWDFDKVAVEAKQ